MYNCIGEEDKRSGAGVQMNQTIEAIYENGALRPMEPLGHLHEGQRVIVTVEPVGDLTPQEFTRRSAELIHRLEAEGMVEPVSPPEQAPPADWHPLILEGEPLSETIIKMRREE